MMIKFIVKYYHLREEVFCEEISAPNKVLADFIAKIHSVAYGTKIGRNLRCKVYLHYELIDSYGKLIDCIGIFKDQKD